MPSSWQVQPMHNPCTTHAPNPQARSCADRGGSRGSQASVVSMMRPCARRRTRSMRPASSGLWVAISAARPVFRTTSSSIAKTRPEVSVSRLPVGSSASSSARAVGQRPRDGDPLLLAAGKLGRPVVEPVRETHRAEERARPLGCGGAIGAGGTLRQRHVLQRGELGQEVVELIDEADGVAAEPGTRAVAEAGGRLADQPERAVARHVEKPGNMQERGLAGAGGRHQRHHLAGGKRQARAFEHAHRGGSAGIVGLAHRLECQHLTHSATPRPGSAGRRCARGSA